MSFSARSPRHFDRKPPSDTKYALEFVPLICVEPSTDIGSLPTQIYNFPSPSSRYSNPDSGSVTKVVVAVYACTLDAEKATIRANNSSSLRSFINIQKQLNKRNLGLVLSNANIHRNNNIVQIHDKNI